MRDERTRPEAATAAGVFPLSAMPTPLELDDLLAGSGPVELEIGFGRGRFLLRRAAEAPQQRFVGIEIAREYFELVARRLERQRLTNVLLLRGDALYVCAALLPAEFAIALHVYFPDPWPKTRHQKRRLFAAESIDLLIRLLAPGGHFYFATDFLDYGAEVESILRAYPGLAVERRETPWQDGARTNYEAKYVREGRPIVRLEAVWPGVAGEARPHPAGTRALAVGRIS